MLENTTMPKKIRDTSSLSLQRIMRSQDTMTIKTTQNVQRQTTLTIGTNLGMPNRDTTSPDTTTIITIKIDTTTIIGDRIDISTPMIQMMRFTMEKKAEEMVIRDS